jgi:3-hydroxybutyryl-CoA dehydrogenase
VDGKPELSPEESVAADLPERVWVSARDAVSHAQIAGLISAAGVALEQGERPSDHALIIVAPLGKDATAAAIEEGLDATRTVALDCLLPVGACSRRTMMTTPVTEVRFREQARALFANDGAAVTTIRDSNGFVAQRVVASIVNVGCDIAQQRIASPEDIDRAVTLGLGYPKGPLALGDAIGAPRILQILSNMQGALGDPRYRPSPWLIRRAQLGASLTHADT